MPITHRIETAAPNAPPKIADQLDSTLKLSGRRQARSLSPGFSHTVQWTVEEDVEATKKKISRILGPAMNAPSGGGFIWMSGRSKVFLSTRPEGQKPMLFLFYTNYKK